MAALKMAEVYHLPSNPPIVLQSAMVQFVPAMRRRLFSTGVEQKATTRATL